VLACERAEYFLLSQKRPAAGAFPGRPGGDGYGKREPIS
jgi:hypothetical protein